ncbi:hypothetical protein MTP99_005001 [Tenebrio molitor]|nr:hypothetical protein MTP99_005001 [Tenebrio molitor]CAH1381021.1 unnamed protein product [Tenebrio molitor]
MCHRLLMEINRLNLEGIRFHLGSSGRRRSTVVVTGRAKNTAWRSTFCILRTAALIPLQIADRVINARAGESRRSHPQQINQDDFFPRKKKTCTIHH